MPRNLQWSVEAWADYVYWQKGDKAVLKKINRLITDILRNPFSGIGKPEPLTGTLSGFWSRRIDRKNRIVYTVSEETVIIIECKTHYGDK